nr:S-norcoclaurine synthase 2-like isoform X1 [Solanum lycopersicum]
MSSDSEQRFRRGNHKLLRFKTHFKIHSKIEIFGTISDEIEVNVPSNVAWELYGTLHLSRFIVQEMPTLLNKVDVIEGDGSTATVLKIIFPEGTPGIPYFKERFNIVDNEKRYKLSQVIEGGYVDLGYIFYGIRFEVNEKDENSCITKFTVNYEVEE